MTTLLIADNHPIVREGLKSVVSQYDDLRVVGEAEDAEETTWEGARRRRGRAARLRLAPSGR